MKIIIDKIVYKVMSRLLVIRAPHAGPNKFFRTGQRYENIVSDVPAPAWAARVLLYKKNTSQVKSQKVGLAGPGFGLPAPITHIW